MDADAPIALIVDLDGTFSRGDTLKIMARRLLRHRPVALPGAFLALTRGRDELKLFLWRTVGLDVRALAYAADIVEWLQHEASKGRHIYLATGAPQELADAVVDVHRGIFRGAFGTRRRLNLTGSRKARLLVGEFGRRGFDYAGNSGADLAVWSEARAAIVCHAPQRVRRRARTLGNVAREFPGVNPRPPSVRA